MANQLAIKFRKSSSLIILAKDKIKDKQTDFKALLFNRHEKASFMPNSAVFPGGVCESADETPLWLKHFKKMGITQEQLKPFTEAKGQVSNIYKNENADTLDRELSLRITAIRETFEELGIIFCRDRNALSTGIGQGYGNFKEDFNRKHWQSLVHNDASKFLTLCEELNIVPDLWSLYEWSNWFTPSSYKKRFDTAFFIIAVKTIPDVLAEKTEVKDFAWKTPDDYLKAYYNKDIWLPPPQFYELSRLLNFTELEHVKKFAQKRSVEGNIVTLPVQYKCKNGEVSLLPGDSLYPDNPNDVDGLIPLNKQIEEFRDGVKNVHRIEFFNLHDAVWKTPADYLKAYFNKEIWLPTPQIYELSRLLNFTELDQVKQFAKQRSAKGSIVSMSVQYKCKNGQVNILPGDDLYPAEPFSITGFIPLDKQIKEFRDGVENLHRIEYFNSHDAVIRFNIKPFCGHVTPVNANPNKHD